MTQLTDRPTPIPALPASPGAPRMRDEAGVRFALLHVALVVATLLTGGLTGPASGAVRLAVLGTVVLAAAFVLPVGPSLAVALSAWALWDGFVAHGLGQLVLAPGDLARLGLLLGVAGAAGLLRPRTPRAGRRRG